MLELASKMSAATVHQYTYGLAYQLNEYTADGTIFDYMAGIRRVSSASCLIQILWIFYCLVPFAAGG